MLTVKAAAQRRTCFCKQIFSLFCHHGNDIFLVLPLRLACVAVSVHLVRVNKLSPVLSKFFGVVSTGQLLVVVVCFFVKLLFSGSSQLNCVLEMV